MKSTERFGDRADVYAAHRPGYPAAVIDAIFCGLGDPTALTVADVGAGTGISSRALAERGAHVIAIEPNASMREQGTSAMATPAPEAGRIEWSDGTGEATGLPNGSVDIVTAFQAFHWFATPESMAEFHRIARRRAVMVQYDRDENDPFTRAYGDIVRSFAMDNTETLRARGLEVFATFPDATVSRYEFSFAHDLDLEGLLGRASSASYLPRTGAAAESLRRQLNDLFAKLHTDGRVSLEMRAVVLVADQ